MSAKKKIAILCNAVTLAHPARCTTLAKALNPDKYDITLYMDDHYDALLGDLPFTRQPLGSTSPQEFARRLSRGEPLFDQETVQTELTKDFEILEQEKPDLVIGDMRITLQISARVKNIPYLNLTNAYWSPYSHHRYPMPDLPIARAIGFTAAEMILNLLHPVIFRSHTAAINQALTEHGLPSHGNAIKQTYTDADYVAYCDLGSLIPLPDAPDNHTHIGPVQWAPENIPLPEWWNEIPEDRPLIYVNLGSSGDANLLPNILDNLSDLEATIITGTAGAELDKKFPDSIYTAAWLPGDQICAKASVVLSNGGAPSTMQALAGGAYSIGICNNMDQLMNMQYLERAGVGQAVRAHKISRLPNLIKNLLSTEQIAVKNFQTELNRTSAAQNFATLVQQILS